MTYTVKSGDSLSLIAQRLLGSSGEWNTIMFYNPNIADPNLIYPGMELYIPDGAVNSTANVTSYDDDESYPTEPGFSKSTLLFTLAALIIVGAFLLIPRKKGKIEAETAGS